jgi:diamine N-acetyltransferase
MEEQIEFTRDYNVIAQLNSTIQEHHITMYPDKFRKTNINEIIEFYKKQFEDPNWFCLLLSINEEPIGYVLFFIRYYKENPFRKAYIGVQIDQISINPEYKRKGYGIMLMNKVEIFAKEHNATQMELTFWEKNIEAKQFYEKLGFSPDMEFTVKKIY